MVTHPKTVLIFSPWASRPGHYWPCTVALARALQGGGIVVKILAPGAPQDVEDAGVDATDVMPRIARLATNRLIRPISGIFFTLATILRGVLGSSSRGFNVFHFINGQQIAVALLTLMKPDVIVINNLYGFPEAQSSQEDRAPIPRLKRRVRNWIIRRAVATDRLWLVVETAPILRAFQATYGARVVEIPYSLSPALPVGDKAEARLELSLPAGRFIFLIFGTHREGKDYETVIRALSLVDERAMVFFAGKLISNNDPHRYAKALPGHRTAFLDGFVTDHQMALSFTACDALIIPYEEGFERGSGVLIEAARYQRAVLATDAGYLRSFVSEHGVGLLYKAADSKDLARQMTAMMQPGRVESFAPAVAETARIFSWDHAVEKYIQIYSHTAFARPAR